MSLFASSSRKRLAAILPTIFGKRVRARALLFSLVTALSAGVYLLSLQQNASGVPLTGSEMAFGGRALIVIGLAGWIGLRDPQRVPTTMEQRQGQIVTAICVTLLTLILSIFWFEPRFYATPWAVLAWVALALAMLSQIWWLTNHGWVHLGATLLTLGGIMHLIGIEPAQINSFSTAFVYVIVIVIAGLCIQWWAGLLVAALLPPFLASIHLYLGGPTMIDWSVIISQVLFLSTIAGLVTLYARSLAHALAVAETRAGHLAAAQVELQTMIIQQESRIANATMALSQREAHFRSLVQNSSDVITIMAADGTMRDQMPTLTHIFGYDPATLTGLPLQAWLHPQDVERLPEFIASVLQQPGQRVAIEWRLSCADGRYLHVETIGTNLTHDINVQGIVLNTRDISERAALAEQLTYQAFHDPLTQLANRALFMDRLNHALLRNQPTTSQCAVLFLDLDRFKVINDSLGHEMGDHLLIAIAERLQTIIRPGDMLARLGGDEFTLLLEQIDTPQAAIQMAEHIQAVLQTPLMVNDREMYVSTSIGIAFSTADPNNAADLLRQADVAMYAAKHHGKAAYMVFEPRMNEHALERLALEHDLRRALERSEFRLAYQPIVDLHTNQHMGVEALLRWQHPERGMVAPAHFLPIAEETGLIKSIGRWVLLSACHWAAAWTATESNAIPPMISVNLSARQMEAPGFVDEVAAILQTTGLAPGRLKLEITERVLMENVGRSQRTLQALKALGVQIAIDDFGVEYSSLSYLKHFPVDILKLDQSFVSGLGHQSVDNAIVQALVTLAQTLKLQLIAEGIETATQVDILCALGCRWGQGYYLGRPQIAPLPAGVGGTMTGS